MSFNDKGELKKFANVSNLLILHKNKPYYYAPITPTRRMNRRDFYQNYGTVTSIKGEQPEGLRDEMDRDTKAK